jgi:hypothetical protein
MVRATPLKTLAAGRTGVGSTGRAGQLSRVDRDDGVWSAGPHRAQTAGMGVRVARAAVLACVAATLAMVIGALVLGRGLAPVPGVPYHPHARDVLIQPVFVLTGAALAWLRPRNALGWLLVAMGTTNIGNVFLSAYGVRAHVEDGGLPGGDVALAMASWLWYPLVLFLPTLLPLLYPTGHLPSPRWRAAVLTTAVVKGAIPASGL